MRGIQDLTEHIVVTVPENGLALEEKHMLEL